MRYDTLFSDAQSPISEAGAWANLSSNRTLVDVSGGIAFGTQSGSGGYDDSYARLTQTWRPDTEIITTLSKGNPSGIQEVEHLHRVSDGGADPSKVYCYEINFARDGSYVDFIRWDGGILLANFHYLIPTGTYAVSGGLNDGDRLRTTMVGNALNAYVDKGAGWVKINTGGAVLDTDGAGGGALYTTGRPGMGFYRESGSGNSNQFALGDFSAREYRMATTAKRLYGPAALTTSAVTKYTCPASTVAVIRRMRVSNPSGGALTFTLSIGADAAGTRLYDAVSIPAGGSLDIYGPFTLAAAEIIQALGSGTALVLEIDGTETT